MRVGECFVRRAQRGDDSGQVVRYVTRGVREHAANLGRGDVHQRGPDPLDIRRRHTLGAQQQHGDGFEPSRPTSRSHDGASRLLGKPYRSDAPQLERPAGERRRHPGPQSGAVPSDRHLPAPAQSCVICRHKRSISIEPSLIHLVSEGTTQPASRETSDHAQPMMAMTCLLKAILQAAALLAKADPTRPAAGLARLTEFGPAPRRRSMRS